MLTKVRLDNAVPAINADLAPGNKPWGVTGKEDNRTLKVTVSEI